MFSRIRIASVLFVAIVFSLGFSLSSFAQQATPNSGGEQTARTFPASINEGTCDQVGNVWYDLSPVGLPEGAQIVAAPAVPAYESVSTIPNVQLDNFANGKYILVVGRSQDEPDAVVACGFVGGTRYGDNLLFSILPNGDATQFAGVVEMTQTGADVSVTIHLMSGAENTDATPVAGASPVADASVMASPAEGGASVGQLPPATEEANSGAAQTELTVTMLDIKFDPKTLTIPAGTDVTITVTNKGAAVHNFNIDALGVTSGDVQPGASVEVKINAQAGEYQYYCSIPGHKEAGMIGELVVQ